VQNVARAARREITRMGGHQAAPGIASGWNDIRRISRRGRRIVRTAVRCARDLRTHLTGWASSRGVQMVDAYPLAGFQATSADN